MYIHIWKKRSVSIFINFIILLYFAVSVHATATDSAELTPLIPTVPTIDCASAGGYTINGGAGCAYAIIEGREGTINWEHLSATPYQTSIGLNNSYSQRIDYSGTYLIIAFFKFKQKTAAPFKYWIDDWAYFNADYKGNVIQASATRIFYSGDAPTLLNLGENGVTTAYYSGIVHLVKDSYVSAPRIWTCSYCGYADIGLDRPSSMQCGLGNNLAPCFYIYLLSYP